MNNSNNKNSSLRKGSLLSNLGISTNFRINNLELEENKNNTENENNENSSNNKKPFMMYTKLINLAAKKNIDDINTTSLNHLKKNNHFQHHLIK